MRYLAHDHRAIKGTPSRYSGSLTLHIDAIQPPSVGASHDCAFPNSRDMQCVFNSVPLKMSILLWSIYSLNCPYKYAKVKRRQVNQLSNIFWPFLSLMGRMTSFKHMTSSTCRCNFLKKGFKFHKASLLNFLLDFMLYQLKSWNNVLWECYFNREYLQWTGISFFPQDFMLSL